MKKQPREVKIINLINEYGCDSCGEGLMTFNSEKSDRIKFANDEMYYPHKCSHCGYESDLTEKYPYLTQKYQPL